MDLSQIQVKGLVLKVQVNLKRNVVEELKVLPRGKKSRERSVRFVVINSFQVKRIVLATENSTGNIKNGTSLGL